LTTIGPHDPSAVAGLVKALADEDPTVRLSAAKGLAKVGPVSPSTIAALRRAQADPEEDVRRAVAESLGQLRQRQP
jgi:HEAT repeat protein